MDSLIIDKSKRWTVEDYLQMEEGVKSEILDGELIMAPDPSISHQRTVGQLYQKLVSFVNHHKTGELFFAPVGVYFDQENIYQPDLVFVLAPNADIIKEKGILAPLREFFLFLAKTQSRNLTCPKSPSSPFFS